MFCGAKKIAVQDIDDEDEDRATYIKNSEIEQGLIEKFGADEIHLRNLKDDLAIESFKTLGSGGFSVVKIGYSKKIKENIAVKIIRTDEEKKKSYIENFLPIEINIWKELSGLLNSEAETCQYILNLKMQLQIENFVYVATEVAEHGCLSDWIKSGALSEAKSRRVFTQIATAVKFCHDHGIAHRDIKPDNVLLDKSDNVKLADFGFATKDNPIIEHSCGTPGMMAPEQCDPTKTEPYDPFISDIWQLGVTLYIILFKKKPFNIGRKASLTAEINNLAGGYKGVPIPRNKMVSLDCKEILAGTMCMNTVARLNINQVIEHRWLHARPRTRAATRQDTIQE